MIGEQAEVRAGSATRRAWARCFWLLALVTGVYPTDARAFRAVGGDERFDRQPTVAWAADKITLLFATQGSPLASSAINAAVQSSAVGWRTTKCAAPLLELQLGSFSAARPGDGKSSVEWVTGGWEERGYDPAAPAQTDVQFERNGDGVWEIVEADIYLNADRFSWTEQPGDGSITLEPVLLHEVGHVLGLLHPCGDDVPSVPACSDDPEFASAVMNPAYSAARTEPSDDDQAGVCHLYPRHSDGCHSDDDCSSSLHCDENSDCVPGTVLEGSPCLRNRDCESGACNDAICGRACQSSTSCPALSSCQIEGGVGVCVSTLLDFGNSCAESEECASTKCVLDEHGKGYCTRACEEDSTCPQYWKCGAPKAEKVCVPASIQPSGGACTLGSRAPLSTGAWFIFFAAFCLLRRRFGS